MIQIADVLADEGLAVDNQRDRILQIRANSQNGTFDGKSGHGAGSIAAGPAENGGAECAGSDDGIVNAARNGTFADQKCVRDSGETLDRVVIFVRDRLAGAIGAGHHQHFRRTRRKEQVMQRRVGQHHAEFAVVGSDSGKFDFSPAQAQWAAQSTSSSVSRFGGKLHQAASHRQRPSP